MPLSDFLNQEWDMTESDESVRRVSERLVQGAHVAVKGYHTLDAASERRRQLRRAVTKANLDETLMIATLAGTIAKFIFGRR